VPVYKNEKCVEVGAGLRAFLNYCDSHAVISQEPGVNYIRRCYHAVFSYLQAKLIHEWEQDARTSPG
jgi:hypothetical protein